MSKTALFIQHQRIAPPAMLGDAFAEAGYDNELLLVDETAENNEFPDPRGFDVIIPLGATSHAYEPALLQTWVGAEITMRRFEGTRRTLRGPFPSRQSTLYR